MSETILEVRDVSKSFGEVDVLRGIDLDVRRGETVALLGPSGSGKTTLLRLLMGFEQGNGSIVLRGRRIEGVPPHRRGIGLVFQNYALFPHLSVHDNIAFGPQSLSWETDRIERRVAEMLELVELTGYGARKIAELSGGQQQRVALARALAPEPDLLLLDEPLSNLDPDLRERTRSQLRAALTAVRTSCVLVTHEQDEAFELGDRVAVLSAGRLEQVATPRELYLEPRTPFVAGFIGRSNELPAHADRVDVSRTESSRTVTMRLLGPQGPRVEVRCPALTEPIGPGAATDGGPARSWTVFSRPEHWRLRPAPDEPPENQQNEAGPLSGVLRSERFTGPRSLWLVQLDAGGEFEVAHATTSFGAEHSEHSELAVGDRVVLELMPGALPVAFPKDES